MLITAITHASARAKEYNFRGLTAAGEEESKSAAERYRELTAGSSLPPIEWIISSPKPRCLETVILFAKELANEALEASAVDVDGGLAAGSIEGGELATLAATGEVSHLLVSGHADLVKTLPDSARLHDDAADGGWFQTRPVLFQVEVQPGQPWDDARLSFCESLQAGTWDTLRD